MPVAEERLTVGAEGLTFRVTSEQSAGAITALEVRIPAGGGRPMLHRHDPFELYRVERGELVFYLEDDRGTVSRRIARPGEVVPIAGGREHTVRNESGTEASAFVVFTPGERMERFARAAAELATAGDPPANKILAMAEAHGVEITRPVGEVA